MKFKYNTNIGITLTDPMELKPSIAMYRLITPTRVAEFVRPAVYVRASDVDNYRIRFLDWAKTPIGDLYTLSLAEEFTGGPIIYIPEKLSRLYREEEL